jgi:hypothetical protein
MPSPLQTEVANDWLRDVHDGPEPGRAGRCRRRNPLAERTRSVGSISGAHEVARRPAVRRYREKLDIQLLVGIHPSETSQANASGRRYRLSAPARSAGTSRAATGSAPTPHGRQWLPPSWCPPVDRQRSEPRPPAVFWKPSFVFHKHMTSSIAARAQSRGWPIASASEESVCGHFSSEGFASSGFRRAFNPKIGARWRCPRPRCASSRGRPSAAHAAGGRARLRTRSETWART